jgi:hypothetical protein
MSTSMLDALSVALAMAGAMQVIASLGLTFAVWATFAELARFIREERARRNRAEGGGCCGTGSLPGCG